MDGTQLLPLSEWIARAGLAGKPEVALLRGFCERAGAAGLPLSRATLGSDTLHPVLGGYGFEWNRGAEVTQQRTYGRTEFDSSDRWLKSPLHHLLQVGEPSLRRRLDERCRLDEFPILADLKAQGMTDYVAFATRLGESATIGEMDCVYSSWTTERAGGFDESDLAALDHLVPCLALAIKSAAVARIADTLVETYLGRDAGRRVMRGHIARGIAEKIQAVLWFSDLQGFTKITDSAPPAEIIPLLNDYADAVVSAIHGQDGQVLKFIGDGIMATFAMADPEEACRRALDAAADAEERVAALNARRAAAGLPVTRFYLALHLGAVFYGNIGSVDRLDFTVVGPAVNEASRIAALCRSLDQEILLSAAFAEAAGAGRNRLVSVGRYLLRGVSRPQMLFTLDPER